MPLRRIIREIVRQCRWALPAWLVGLMTNWWPDNRISIRVRGFLMSPFIGDCGRNFQLGANVTLLTTESLVVGDDVYIARGGWLNAIGGLTLEDQVVLAPYVVISTAQHVFNGGSVRFGGSLIRPVIVQRGSWLAAHVAVRCGVTIGAGSLIAANSAVTKDVPAHSLVGGVPGKVLGSVEDGVPDVYARSDLPDGG